MWWLVRKANGQTPSIPAAWELWRRWTQNELSERDVAQVAEYVLSLAQRKDIASSPQWSGALVQWGPLLEQARSNGNLTDERWRQFWTEAIPLYVHAKLTPATESGRLMVDVGCGMFNSQHEMHVTYHAVGLFVGDVECDPVDLGGGVMNLPSWSFRGGGSGDREVPLIAIADAPAGEQKVRCIFEAEVTEHAGRTRDSGRVIARTTCERQTTITLPAGYRPLMAVRDPTLLKAMKDAIRIRDVQFGHDQADSMNVDHVTVVIDVASPPVGIGVDVKLCRLGEDRGWTVGKLTNPAGVTRTYQVTQPVIGFNGALARIILQRNVVEAARAGMPKAWAQDLIFEDVPVSRATSAQR